MKRFCWTKILGSNGFNNTIMVSKKISRIGVQKTLMQKTYEISIGSNSISMDLLGLIDNFTG